MHVTLFLARAEDTQRLGYLLGQGLEAGDVVALTGDLGAGKTCLTQGLARGLGVPEDVAVVSPSYTLVNEYSAPVPLFHLDLYRLDSEDFEFGGFDEYFEKRGVTVIEWADRIENRLPEPRLVIRLTASGSGRKAELQGVGADFDSLLSGIRQIFTSETP